VPRIASFSSQAFTGFLSKIAEILAVGDIDPNFDIGTGFGGRVFAGVSAIAVQSDGDIVVGGSFRDYNGESDPENIMRLRSSGSKDNFFNRVGFFDPQPGPGFNGSVSSILIQPDQKILVGGGFTTYNDETVAPLIRLNTDGSIDTSFDASGEIDSAPLSMAFQNDGKLILGGGFNERSSLGQFVTRLNSDGSGDFFFDTDFFTHSPASLAVVRTVAIQSDGKILVGGTFDNYDGVTVGNIARLNSDGSRDSSFNSGIGFNNGVEKIVIQPDGKILVGGFFVSYDGITANRIIRLNPDGSRDNTFDVGDKANASVDSIALQSNGKILVGGSFTSYNGIPQNYLTRLTSDGSIDTSFDIGTGIEGSNVRVITIQPDNKILVGGRFTSYDGVSQNNLTRII